MRLARNARHGFVCLWLIGSVFAVQASPGPQASAVVAPGTLAPLLNSATSPEPTKLGGVLVITVRGGKFDKSEFGKQKLEETLIGESERVKVAFDAPTEIKTNTDSTDWAVPFNVSGMPPLTTVTRYVKFKVGNVDWTLPFLIASPPAEAPAATQGWSVKPWPANGRALDLDEGMPLFVSVPGPAPRAALKVANLDLVEQSTKKTTSWSGWRLCLPADSQEKSRADTCSGIDATKLGKGVHEFRLKLPEKRSLQPGKYEGVLVVSSEAAADGVVQDVNVLLYASSTGAKVCGFLAILCGVLVSTLLTSFGRRWIDRQRLLIPAAVLQQSIRRLKNELGQIKGDPVNGRPSSNRLDKALQDATGSLSQDSLVTHGLPPRIPLPGVPIDAGQLDLLKTFLDAQAALVLRWQAIVERGVLAVEAHRARHGTLLGVRLQAYKDAYEALDVLAEAAALDSTPIGQRVDEIVKAFKDALAPKPRSLAAARTLPSAQLETPPLPTPERLRLRVKEGSILTWALVLVVTVGVGTHLLVLGNPGFGTVADKLNCLFWGLGLGTGAAALGINVNSVLTSFNLTR